MPSKKDNLPTNVDVDLENGGTIKYANEVIAIIAGVAASEVDGIAGMCTSGGFSDIIGRNRSITRGVKVEVASEEASVELYIVVEYGSPIQKVAAEVQENVRKAIETMTGLHVVNVDVHVQGVSFEKEKKALESGLESAHLTSEEAGRIQAQTRKTLKMRHPPGKRPLPRTISWTTCWKSWTEKTRRTTRRNPRRNRSRRDLPKGAQQYENEILGPLFDAAGRAADLCGRRSGRGRRHSAVRA